MDAVAIIFFMIGLALRFKSETMAVGRVIYCIDSIYWYLRILNILGVNKYLGSFYLIELLVYGCFIILRYILFRSVGYNDGENGEEYDIFRRSFAGCLDEFRGQQTSYSIPE